MRDRCARDANYSGVAVCPRWDSFANFLEDMGTKPEGKTLDREDNALGYFKGNCRWATQLEQARNKTDNVKYWHNGAYRTLTELSEITGIAHKTLFSRINQRGWSPEQAFAVAVDRSKRNNNARDDL